MEDNLAAKQSTKQDHVLLLKHVKLDEKSSEDILNKYNISKMQLPIISKKDPALKDLEVEHGDVIEIERASPTTNKVKIYRMVR